MKVIFINLHKINFLLSTYSQIQSGWSVKTFKHKFFLDYLISKRVNIINLLSCCENDTDREINEAEFVYEKNGYKTGVINNYLRSDIEKIKDTDILIIYFHYFGGYILSKEINCKKILFGNHFIRVKKGQYFDLNKDGFLAFVNEINVQNNEFIKTFFNINNIQIITFPYIFAGRFESKVNLMERKNKAMAIGTLSTTEGIDEYSGYRDYYKTAWVQPMRLEILKNKKRIKKYIDSYISYIYEEIGRAHV